MLPKLFGHNSRTVHELASCCIIQQLFTLSYIPQLVQALHISPRLGIKANMHIMVVHSDHMCSLVPRPHLVHISLQYNVQYWKRSALGLVLGLGPRLYHICCISDWIFALLFIVGEDWYLSNGCTQWLAAQTRSCGFDSWWLLVSLY